MCFMSMTFMSSFAVMTKYWITDPFILCVVASILQTLFSIMCWKEKGPFFCFKLPIFIIGLCEVVDFVGRILCVRYLPVSLAMAINASTPIYAVLMEAFVDPYRFSRFMKLKRFAVVVLICASIGVQSHGSLNSQEYHSFGSTLFGVFLAVSSSVARVAANFTIERTNDEDILLHHFLMGNVYGYLLVPCLIPFIINESSGLVFADWAKGFCIGIIFVIGCYFSITTFSYHDIAVTTALAMRALEIPTVFFFGAVFLGEPVNSCATLGCASVTFWSVYMIFCLSSEQERPGENVSLLDEVTLKRRKASHMGGNFAALGLRARFEIALCNLGVMKIPTFLSAGDLNQADNRSFPAGAGACRSHSFSSDEEYSMEEYTSFSTHYLSDLSEIEKR